MTIYKTGKRKYYKYGTELDANIVGNFARLDKGVASGFSTSQYLKLPATFNPQNNPWEALFKVKINTLINGGQIILGQRNSGGYNFYVDVNTVRLSVGDTSFTGTTTLQENTTYWFKYIFTGDTYIIKSSTNGVEWIDEVNTASTITATPTSDDCRIGVWYNTYSSGLGNPFFGSIDLSQSYININGERWWSGNEYTTVGSWIDDGVVGRFTSSNYTRLPFTFEGGSYNNWELVTKIKVNSYSSGPTILCVNSSYGIFNYALTTSGRVQLALSTNTDSFNICSDTGEKVLDLNTWYWYKAEFTGTAYNTYWSIDGKVWNLDSSVQKSTKLGNISALNFGIRTKNNDQILDGYIDMQETYFKANGADVWHGTKAYQVNLGGEDVYQDWTQPTNMTSAGTMGGDSFAVAQSSAYNSNDFWKIFASSPSLWHSAAGLPQWVSWYNPNPMKVTKLSFKGLSDGNIGNGIVQACDDNSSWIDIVSFSNTNSTGDFEIDLSSNDKAYKYWRIYTTSCHYVTGGNYYPLIAAGFKITAQERVAVGGDTYDYTAVEPDKIKDVYSLKQNTNCLLNIPQDINLELTDGALTLKAGSKVYVPNGFEKTKKYYKDVVTTKYWKEITTGGRELEYACYKDSLMGMTIYSYAKTPLGSDMLNYYTSDSSQASDSSQLKNAGETYSKITEEYVTASNNNYQFPRYREGDLYIDTTVTETVEGTPEDYTYTTEETVTTEVSADDDWTRFEEIDTDVKKFDEVVIESDVIKSDWGSGDNGIFTLFLNINGSYLYGSNSQASGTSTSAYGGMYYRTEENYIYPDNNSSNEKQSLPICSVYLSNGTVTSIDQVFNGFGYIGSTVFALPNVKGLIPDGKNADGSLKSIEFIYNDVETYTNTDSPTGNFYIQCQKLYFGRSSTSTWNYNQDTNFVEWNGENTPAMFAGTFELNEGKITSFTPKSVEGYTKKARILTTYKTGKRKYYKYEYQNWKQPVLTANDSYGKLTSSGINESQCQPYSALDGVASGAPQYKQGWISGSSTGWWKWELPVKLSISAIKFYNPYSSTSVATTGQFFIDEGITPLTESFSTANSSWASYNLTVVNDTPTDIIYFKMTGGGANGGIGELTITAQEQLTVESTSSDYDLSLVEAPQLVYNLKYDLTTTANWQSVGTITGHNFFGSGTFSEYISATREGAVTFNTPLPSGKYTWRFLYYSQVNHTFGTYKITATYEDGTTEVVYNSSLGDTAYGGGEKATLDLSLTFKKPVKVLTNYTNSWGSGSGCYGGSGNVQLFFDGSKQ